MKDWFRDNLKLGSELIGSYDDRQDEYNITLKGETIAKTVSFKEDVRGWVSFKSFIPENGLSCANDYYTFDEGNLWKHHDESANRNTFYDTFNRTSFKVILNDMPGSVKAFHTLNYEGTQSRVNELLSYSIYIPGTVDMDPTSTNYGIGIIDPSYASGIPGTNHYNLQAKQGWYVLNIKTDKEEGGLNEFIEKEGKWFNYIKGKTGSIGSQTGSITGGFDNADSSFQGLGVVSSVTPRSVHGCTDDTTFIGYDGNTYPNAVNYDENATIDDGSCTATDLGCMDSLADGGTNWVEDGNSPNMDTDPTSCIYYGCTDPALIGYNPNANVDDGSCEPYVYGCMDATVYSHVNGENITLTLPSSVNYAGPGNANGISPVANTACDDSGIPGCCDGGIGCVPPHCTGPGNPPGDCCEASIPGCMDSTADNYNPIANVDDQYCLYIEYGCIDFMACNNETFGLNCSSPYVTCVDDSSCGYCGLPNADNYDGGTIGGDLDPANFPDIYGAGGCSWNCLVCQNITNLTLTPNNYDIVVSWDAWGVNPGVPYSGNIWQPAPWINITVTWKDQLGNVIGQNTIPSIDVTYTIPNLTPDTQYTVEVIGNCANTSSINGYEDDDATTTIPDVYGCTDGTGVGNTVSTAQTACNFNPLATVDDGSCEYLTCAGCTDPLYLEFCNTCWDAVNQVAVTDGSGGPWLGTFASACATPIVYGCMDPAAFNYDSAATNDDGSCVAIVLGCMDDRLGLDGTISATNYDALVNTDDGSCVYPLPTLSVTQDPITQYFQLNVSGNVPAGSASDQFITISQVTNASGYVYPTLDSQFNMGGANTIESYADLQPGDSGIIPDTIAYDLGTNNVADNPHTFELALVYANGTPAQIFYFNYYFTLTVDFDIIAGCTDSSNNCNYDPNANITNGTDCITPAGCDQSSAENYDASTTCPDNTTCAYCADETPAITAGVPGDTTIQLDWSATTYADVYRVRYKKSTQTVWTLEPGPNNDNNIPTNSVLIGSHDAPNGNPKPLEMSTEYQVQVKAKCINGNSGWSTAQTYTTTGGVGCMHVTAVNYDSTASIPGDCVYQGCPDPLANNYSDYSGSPYGGFGGNAYSTVSCEYHGCTDPTAANYFAYKCCNDGSCVYTSGSPLGCMDPVAVNYNSNANTDDGTCIYVQTGCTTDTTAVNYNTSYAPFLADGTTANPNFVFTSTLSNNTITCVPEDQD